MPAQLIDGKKVAEITRRQIREDVENWKKQGNRAPFLQVIQVGNDPASSTYIGAKTRACNDVGIDTGTAHLPDTISAKELKQEIRKFNEDIEGYQNFEAEYPGCIELSAADYAEDVSNLLTQIAVRRINNEF